MWRVPAAILAALTATLAMYPIGAQETAPAAKEIQVSAVKYEFKPDVITVKQGDHVKLVITAEDHDHGFKLDAFHIEQKLPKGTPVTIEFTAEQAGTFPFQCSQFCGLGHKKMKGRLVVE
jgi:cytochrome c oxidase subunit 2